MTIGNVVGEDRFNVGGIALELVDFFGPKEYLIEGTDMIERAKKLNAHLGQVYADFMLDNAFRIPEEWKDFDLVFSAATQEIDGSQCILYLHFQKHHGSWLRGYGFRELDWNKRARLLRVCN